MTAPIIETAGALLVRAPSLVLFGLRASWKASWPDHWDAIGGRLEPGETPDVALVREVREEVGVTITAYRHLTAASAPGYRHHIFAVTAWSGEPANLGDEHTEIRWCELAELTQLPSLAGIGYPELAARACAMLGSR